MDQVSFQPGTGLRATLGQGSASGLTALGGDWFAQILDQMVESVKQPEDAGKREQELQCAAWGAPMMAMPFLGPFAPQAEPVETAGQTETAEQTEPVGQIGLEGQPILGQLEAPEGAEGWTILDFALPQEPMSTADAQAGQAVFAGQAAQAQEAGPAEQTAQEGRTPQAGQELAAQAAQSAQSAQAGQTPDIRHAPQAEAARAGSALWQQAKPVDRQAGQELRAQPQQEEVPVAVAEQTQKAEGQDQGERQPLLGGEQSFRSAVAQAKRLMRDLPDQEQTGAADFQALQRAADTARTSRTAQVETRQATPAQVAEQVKTGVVQHLGDGKSEYTIKLRPEGLGEVTVKAVAQDGKIALSIMASSQETAKLLSSGMESLRASLRPYQAEVQFVPTPSQPDSGQDAYHAQQQGFAFEQQQRQQGRQPEGDFRAYYAGQEEAPAQETAQSILESLLDTAV